MSVVPIRGRDPSTEARTLLNCVLRDGDIIGTDDAGRTALLLVVDPWTLDRLLAFDADATDLEDTDSEPEPDEEVDGPATVLDFAPPKQLDRPSRVPQALAFALLLVTVPHLDVRAHQAPAMTRALPPAEAPAQCCRICRKGQPYSAVCLRMVRVAASCDTSAEQTERHEPIHTDLPTSAMAHS